MMSLFKVDANLVSIILPVFNGERFLATSIQSCLNQTYQNIELIIVNDSSTDRSLEIAEKFQAKDKRVSIISNSINEKLPASLNVGHKFARGAYMTWTSDDNYFELTAIEKMVSGMHNNESDIIYSNFNIVGENGDFKSEFVHHLGSTLLLGNTVGACFLYKKEVFFRNGGYDEDLHTVEDYDFWLQACLHSKFYHIQDYLYNFRTHSNSLSYHLSIEHSSSNSKFNEGLLKSYSKFFNKLKVSRAGDYPQLFSKLHQYKRIDVASFLKEYSSFKKEMKKVCDGVTLVNSESLTSGIDIRLRANIQTYKENQNLKTLSEIFRNRPVLLLGYSRIRGLQIFLKCLT